MKIISSQGYQKAPPEAKLACLKLLEWAYSNKIYR